MTAQATTTPAEQADTTPSPVDREDTTTPARGATTRVEALDPRTLLVDVNVREDARVDRDFIASVHDLGVLVPIVAVRTATGAARVRFGHRRTRAAVIAGLSTVPVVVVADEATSTAGQVERLVTQWAENEHRTGLTLGEQVGVVGQLAAFGVSAAQIAKRTRLARPRVDAALVVAGSGVAKAAAVEHDLDLVEAAVVAEFASDSEAVDRLVDAAGSGRFDHVAQRLRDDRVRTDRRAAYAAGLEADGISVVSPGVGVLLRDLTDPAGATLTPESHAGCPGHAAQIGRSWGRVDRATGLPATGDEADQDNEDDQDAADDDGDDGEPVDDGTVWAEYPVPEWVCTDHTGCGHIRRVVPATRGQVRLTRAEMTPEQADAARAQRRDVIESNKSWGSAVVVRQSWVRALLTSLVDCTTTARR